MCLRWRNKTRMQSEIVWLSNANLLMEWIIRIQIIKNYHHNRRQFPFLLHLHPVTHFSAIYSPIHWWIPSIVWQLSLYITFECISYRMKMAACLLTKMRLAPGGVCEHLLLRLTALTPMIRHSSKLFWKIPIKLLKFIYSYTVIWDINWVYILFNNKYSNVKVFK